MAGIVITPNELRTRFGYHPPKDSSVAKTHEDIRAACHELATNVAALCPPSRETSLAITAIEEAMMWANAAVARHQHEDATEAP